jgi:hypothetical protein
MPKLYRVTFETQILVLAEDEYSAEDIGRKNLDAEMDNSEVTNLVQVKYISSLKPEEKKSCPYKRGHTDDQTVEYLINMGIV